MWHYQRRIHSSGCLSKEGAGAARKLLPIVILQTLGRARLVSLLALPLRKVANLEEHLWVLFLFLSLFPLPPSEELFVLPHFGVCY